MLNFITKAPFRTIHTWNKYAIPVFIESFGKHEFNDYYFDPDSKQVIQINSGKSRAKIKIIKPSVSNGREIIVIKDSSDKRRTVGYTELVEFCEECVEEEEKTIEE
jgi:hypothetical protein